MRNVKKKLLYAQLVSMKFTKYRDLQRIRSTKLSAFAEEEKKPKDHGSDEEEEEKDSDINEFKYLVSMPMLSLTEEKVEKMKADLHERELAMKALLATPVKDMWLQDLVVLEDVLDEIDLEDKEGTSKMGNKYKGKPMK
jgi:hypothetical protein